MADTATWSENEVGRKWDRCFADAVFKLGGGVFLGSVFSLLFVRRKWPIVVGAGFGLGLAYSNCEKDMNSMLVQTKSSSSKPPPGSDEKKAAKK